MPDGEGHPNDQGREVAPLVERQQHNQKKAQWIKRRAAAEAKRHSDRLESAAYMRRADAEAKAMAIGNIADVLRLKTVSPLQMAG